MNILDNTVNIIGRIDPNKKGEIGTKEFTEQIKEQMDKYAGINIDNKEDGKHAICDLQYVLGYSGTVKTDCKGMKTAENPIKKNMELVNNLTPDNIGANLPKILKDLDNTMILQGQYFIVAHLPYDDSKNIKAGGRMMLVKFLDNEDKPELYTSYDNVQSTDHKITLGSPENYRLINGKYISNKKSATKIQAWTRRRKVIQKANTVRMEKEAAEKIQALARGNIGRQKASNEKQKRVDYEKNKEEQRKMQENIIKNFKQRKIDEQAEFDKQQQQKTAAEEAAAKKLAELNSNAALKAETEFQQRKRAAQEQKRKEQAERAEAQAQEAKRQAEAEAQEAIKQKNAEKKQKKKEKKIAEAAETKRKEEERMKRWEEDDKAEKETGADKIAAAAKQKKEEEDRINALRKTKKKRSESDNIPDSDIDVGNNSKKKSKNNTKTRKQRLKKSYENRQTKREDKLEELAKIKREELAEKENIKLKSKILAKETLVDLSGQIPVSTVLKSILHKITPTEHTQYKTKIISTINTQIELYNSGSTEEKQIPLLNKKQLLDKPIAIIKNALDIIIKQMNTNLKGGKSTRHRRKLNPTRKLRIIKQNTKKRFKKGVSKRRKTRNKT
jgi:hypothetical protein